MHHSPVGLKEDEFPEVEGSSENVDEEVLFCLKLENGKYIEVIYCELGYLLTIR